MLRIIFRIIAVIDCNFLRTEMNSVLALYVKSTGLPPVIDVIVIPVHFDISGKKKMQLFILNDRRAGIYTMAVIAAVRVQRHTLVSPGNQIVAGIMSPEFQSALCIKRSILKKHMISSLEIAQPIRIIQPARRRHQMMGKTLFLNFSAHCCGFFDLSYFCGKDSC